jgi:glycosyltransferase involved in cell wall biosynthesis
MSPDLQNGGELSQAAGEISVSIVMPCLNEAACLAHCISNAREALNQIQKRYGLRGEVVVADNGSTDGSQALAVSLGARVIQVRERGYGAALIGGFEHAVGCYLVMGDADGSYDFLDCVAMIGRLIDGADLCMGSRFKGGIKPGAMPWKNRYIGNPFLTGILNLFFRAGVDDAHCGLRAIRRAAFRSLRLEGKGMEFASEMIIKASLSKIRIDEVPVTLSPDLRNRPPHLRPWRDGWRHLRYLLMLSPTWAFAVPAALMMAFASAVLFVVILSNLGLMARQVPFGASWTIVAAFMLSNGHFAALIACATHFYGVRQRLRPLRPVLLRLSAVLTLEHALIAGSVLLFASITSFAIIGWNWYAQGFTALPSVLPVALAACAGAIGLQTMFGGFLLAVVVGHDARFVSSDASSATSIKVAEAA